MCCIYDISFVSEGRNAKTLNLLSKRNYPIENSKNLIVYTKKL